MSKWIAEFELEDGDTMPEHMDLVYKGARIDFHCKPLEPKAKTDVLDKVKAEIKALSPEPTAYDVVDGNPIKDAVWETLADVLQIIDKYKGESEK